MAMWLKELGINSKDKDPQALRNCILSIAKWENLEVDD